jgi:hypothetical protein
MTKRFGAGYEAYCKQVPDWWPRLVLAAACQPNVFLLRRNAE